MVFSGGTVGISLNVGFAGNVSRSNVAFIESKIVKSDSANIPFGFPVLLNSDNTVSLGGATLTATNFAGVAVAEVKQAMTYVNSNEGGFYATDQACDIIQLGVISVKVQNGTPTAGGAVYVRKSTSTDFPDATIGGFEAESDGAHTVQLTNCTWNTGVMDADGIAELKIKSINN